MPSTEIARAVLEQEVPVLRAGLCVPRVLSCSLVRRWKTQSTPSVCTQSRAGICGPEGRPEQGTGGIEGASVLSDPGSALTKFHCCGPSSCSVWFGGRR